MNDAQRAVSLPTRIALGVCALGALARVVFCFYDPPLHPDEFFQYLEPAYWHLTGVGLEAWEYREGLRSWVLPFYNGAWLATFSQLGVPDGLPLVRALQVQWALANSWLVWLAYRGGKSAARRLGRADDADAGFEGGVLAAFLCATFPLLVSYAGHTLSELPSTLFLLAGLVEVAELNEEPRPETRRSVRKAALGGFLLSFGACLRIANGPLVLMAPLWLLATRRFRALGALVLAALLPALVFALVDLATWGSLAHSFVAYIKFNFIEGRAATFGTAPASYYLEFLQRRAPYTAPVLLVAALLGVRGNFGFLLPALGAVAYLSTQPHKEERFILAVWPLLFIAAGASLGAACAWARGRERVVARASCAALPLALALATPIEGKQNIEERTWLHENRFKAETLIAKDPTRTGVLIEFPIYGGGAAWIGGPAPQIESAPGLLPNPLISHVLADSNSFMVPLAEAHGFKRWQSVEGMTILRRIPPAAQR